MINKRYICTDGKRKWYTDTIELDLASGILVLDDGRRAFVDPKKFKYFEIQKPESKEEGATT